MFKIFIFFIIFSSAVFAENDPSQGCKILMKKPLKVKCERAEGYLDGDYNTESLIVKINSRSSKFSQITLENLSIDEIKNESGLREKIKKSIGASDFNYSLDKLYISKIMPIFDKNKKVLSGCEFRATPMLTKFKSAVKTCSKTFCMGPAVCGDDLGEYDFYMGCEAKLSNEAYFCPNSIECFSDNSFSNLEILDGSNNNPSSQQNSTKGLVK